MDIKTPRDKYNNDLHYRGLVDLMISHIHNGDYTPSEMREAAILASIIYAEQCIPNQLIPSQIQKYLDNLENWLDIKPLE